MALAVMHAMSGELSELKSFVGGIDDSQRRIRSMHLASTVWHEQRHFLDLILTNYGAFRVRQFFSVYVNLATLISEVRRNGGELFCPVGVYADPVRASALGVPAASAAIAGVAHDANVRNYMARADRLLVATSSGNFEVGGDAQLEGLAYICQGVCIQRTFGAHAWIEVNEDLPEAQRFNLRYRWALLLASQSGVAKVEPLAQNVIAMDTSMLMPILISSLSSRRWAQAQVSDGVGGGSGYPAARLGGLIRTLQGRGGAVKGLTVLEAWELTNELARKLWGKTVMEETLDDLRHEGEWLRQVEENPDTLVEVKEVIRDYHRLRTTLVDRLSRDPLSILTAEMFYEDLLPKLRPLPVVIASAGWPGEPPENLERVFGYRDPEIDHPESRWWWAATPRDWPHDDESLIVLGSRKAWMSVIDELAPITKLLLNGRRHRTMVGPEIMFAEQRLATLGVKCRFDPLFEFPAEPAGVGPYYSLKGTSSARCDVCSKSLLSPEGHLVSPWFFRRTPEYANYAVKAYGGGVEGRLRFWRDWSLWILCGECYEGILRAEEPHQPWRAGRAVASDRAGGVLAPATTRSERSKGRFWKWFRRLAGRGSSS